MRILGPPSTPTIRAVAAMARCSVDRGSRRLASNGVGVGLSAACAGSGTVLAKPLAQRLQLRRTDRATIQLDLCTTPTHARTHATQPHRPK